MITIRSFKLALHPGCCSSSPQLTRESKACIIVHGGVRMCFKHLVWRGRHWDNTCRAHRKIRYEVPHQRNKLCEGSEKSENHRFYLTQDVSPKTYNSRGQMDPVIYEEGDRAAGSRVWINIPPGRRTESTL